LTIAEQKEKHLTLRKATVALDAKRERIVALGSARLIH
jgi:hypothetical protein